MSYGSAAEEERMLSYTPKEAAAAAAAAAANGQQQPPPPAVQPAASSASAAAAAPQHFNPLASASAATEHATSFAKNVWADCRPWTEFHSTRTISVPTFSALSDRISNNLHHYRANYVVVAAFWLAFSFLFHIPRFLMAAFFFFLLERWVASRAAANSGALSHRNTVIAVFAALVIVWVSDIGSIVIFSLTISAVYTLAHAALHVPDPVETEIATV